MQRTLFLVLSSAIVVFSIICLCTAPIINGILSEAKSWGTQNCKAISDEYKYEKDHNGNDDTLESLKKRRNLCNRQKAMYGLEYSSYIIDVSLGFICAVLGLLHFFDVGKSFQKYSGIIGLVTGIVGFVLTLVYIIYSGYIFTKDISEDYDGGFKDTINIGTGSINFNYMIKLNGEGAFAELDGDNYKCIFYKEKDRNAVLAKYKDLGKKSLNYEKKRNYDQKDEYTNCAVHDAVYGCYYNNNGQYVPNPSNHPVYGPSTSVNTFKSNNCKYLYLSKVAGGFGNKYLYDNWLTNIIFGCIIIACEIGLAIFGFLLFKNSDGSGI